MPVSGVVISCEQGSSAAAGRQISDFTSVEICHQLENDTIVAVLDTITVDEQVSLVKALLAVDGVVDVRLAYHNFEDIQEAMTAASE